MKKILPLAVCIIAMLITGCSNTLKTKYRSPALIYPANWYHDEVADETLPFDWKAFNDPQLERWLEKVMTSNNNVAIAVLRVYRSKFDAERVGILSTPQVTSKLVMDARKKLNGPSEMEKSSSASLSTLYEVDLWGKIARQKDAAVWAIHATEEDLRAAQLTLLSEASNNYWRIGFINQQIAVLKQSIRYVEETLRLANARYIAGGVSLLDAVYARQSLLSQESRLKGLQNELKLLLNQQAVLLGATPGTRVIAPASLPEGALPQVNSHIPTSVLRHRPDIAAKEWRVREALATVDIRRTEYYPSFNLTGSLGTSSSSLLTFLQNPAAAAGASLTLPFLEWRLRGVELNIARNDYEQRLLEFKQLLYRAMSSIEDELSLRSQLLAQESKCREILMLARKAELINEVRYRQGAVQILFWLDAQEKRRQVELLLAENRFNQFRNLAKIYLEFGGSMNFH